MWTDACGIPAALSEWCMKWKSLPSAGNTDIM